MNTSELLSYQTPLKHIGDLLVSLNKITTDDVDLILKRQHETGERFGDAAKALSLISEEDIQRVVSLQFDYSLLHSFDDSQLSGELYCAHRPFSDESEGIRTLRSEIISRWIDSGHKSIPVVTSNEISGAAILTANLAISFAQLGLKVLLVDANLRAPSLQRLFNASKGMGLSDLIAGRVNTIAASQRVTGFKDFFILTSGTNAPNPQELLYKTAFKEFFLSVESIFDIVIYNSAPITDYLDALPIVSNAKAAVLYTEMNQTRLTDIENIKKKINAIDCTIIGAVLKDTSTRKKQKIK